MWGGGSRFCLKTFLKEGAKLHFFPKIHSFFYKITFFGSKFDGRGGGAIAPWPPLDLPLQVDAIAAKPSRNSIRMYL